MMDSRPQRFSRRRVDIAKARSKEILNMANDTAGDLLPQWVVKAAAEAMAGAAVSFAEAWMIVAIPIAMGIDWYTGNTRPGRQQRLDQAVDFLKGALARRMVDDMLEAIELKKPLKTDKKMVDFLRRHGCDPNALVGPGKGMPFKDGTRT